VRRWIAKNQGLLLVLAIALIVTAFRLALLLLGGGSDGKAPNLS